jgi:hypothetical protein
MLFITKEKPLKSLKSAAKNIANKFFSNKNVED